MPCPASWMHLSIKTNQNVTDLQQTFYADFALRVSFLHLLLNECKKLCMCMHVAERERELEKNRV